MARENRRDVLRGAEEGTFDLLSEVSTIEGWAELLIAPLERAAAKGNRGLTRKLVAAGAEFGNALHGAVRRGHIGIVNDLLEGGSSVVANDAGGRAPLHLAARGRKSEMVRMLMLKGADKDVMDESECTPLYLAVRSGHLAAALALTAAGACVSTRCCSTLKEFTVHAAARRGHVEILRVLIEHGADVEAADLPGKATALHVAAMENQVGAISVLVGAGANINAGTGFGRTALQLAANWTRLEAVVALLKHGADVNAKDSYDCTPLHHVAEFAHVTGAAEVVDSLLRSGADEIGFNLRGETAMDVADANYGDANRVPGAAGQRSSRQSMASPGLPGAMQCSPRQDAAEGAGEQPRE